MRDQCRIILPPCAASRSCKINRATRSRRTRALRFRGESPLAVQAAKSGPASTDNLERSRIFVNCTFNPPESALKQRLPVSDPSRETTALDFRWILIVLIALQVVLL